LLSYSLRDQALPPVGERPNEHWRAAGPVLSCPSSDSTEERVDSNRDAFIAPVTLPLIRRHSPSGRTGVLPDALLRHLLPEGEGVAPVAAASLLPPGGG
jgi:hypothetical protein